MTVSSGSKARVGGGVGAGVQARKLCIERLEERIVLSGPEIGGAPLTVPVIDDGDVGYLDTGWIGGSLAGGYDGDYKAVASGDGSETASWTWSDLDAGIYDVFVTWTPFSNRATDAPFTVYDGVTSEGTVDVNQRSSPNDEEEFGHVWERLGRYMIDGGSVKVELTNDADGYVIADAVRLEEVDPDGDAFEVNNTSDDAYDLGEVLSALEETDLSIHEAGDVDWFTFTLSDEGNASSRIEVSFLHANGDIDVRLYEDPAFSPILTGTSINDDEVIPLDGLSAGTYYVEVFAWAGATNMYDLSIVPPSAFVDVVIDDGATGYTDDGWIPGSLAGAYDSDYAVSAAGDGSAKATWTFSGLEEGLYKVLATWVAWPNRATNTPFTISDGGTEIAGRRLSQQLAPDDVDIHGVPWEEVGIYRISNGSLEVQISNDADGYVIADGMYLVQAAEAEWVVDDGDSGYLETGTDWWSGSLTGAYQYDYRWHAAGSGANTATWTLEGLQSGSYEVYVTWRAHSNRATDASYSIWDGGQSEGAFEVNQQDSPNDEQGLGSWWEHLGSFGIENGLLTVSLSDDGDSIVIADAVRIVMV